MAIRFAKGTEIFRGIRCDQASALTITDKMRASLVLAKIEYLNEKPDIAGK